MADSARHVRNSVEFTHTVTILWAGPQDILDSLDVFSLFTKVPIGDALHLLSCHFDEVTLRLFRHVLTSSFSIFSGKFCEQTYSVVMGSLLSPAIANYFMEYFEENALEMATDKPLCWFHYIDDMFIIWPHGPCKLGDFIDHLKSVHENIQFTMEMERDDHLPFLDTDI
jgi:hypothetical protein